MFHATFSYILSLSVPQTITSHRLKLTCVCFVNRKRFELFCICIFFLTQRNIDGISLKAVANHERAQATDLETYTASCEKSIVLYYNIAASSVRQPTKFKPIDL